MAQNELNIQKDFWGHPWTPRCVNVFTEEILVRKLNLKQKGCNYIKYKNNDCL